MAARKSAFRRAGARLLALVLASVVSMAATGLGHAGWDDGACDPIPVRHDHNAHRFQGGQPTSGAPDHCLFCHSLRSLGNGVVATHVAVLDTTHAAAVRLATFGVASTALASNAPSRAPPSTLL